MVTRGASPEVLRTLLWVSAAAFGAIAIVLGAWHLTVNVLPVALTVDARMDEFRGLALGEFLEDSTSMATLQRRVDRLQAEVSPATAYASWLGRLSPALVWLPPVDYELAAWAAQADRLERDLATASRLLGASSRLMDAYSRAEADLLSFRNDRPSSLLGKEATDLQSSFATSLDQVSTASRARERYRPASPNPRLGRAMDMLEEIEDQIIGVSRTGEQAAVLLGELLEIAKSVQPLFAELVEDRDGLEPLSAEELTQTLAVLGERLELAMARSDNLVKLANSIEGSGSLIARLEVVGEVLGAVQAANDATVVGLEALGPALQGSGGSSAGIMSGDGNLSKAFEGLADHTDAMDKALARLDDAQQTLVGLNLGKDRAQSIRLEDLDAALGRLRRGLSLMRGLAPVGADLVGAHSTKRYLVLGQSADELRATGGFVSALWLVTFENGALLDVQYHDTVRVDDWDRLMLYPRAPLGLEEHMNAHVWLLRDVSWEPDFPTTARTAADLFRLGQRRDVDGVAAINQWTLLSALEELGSVDSPSGGPPITPRNLFSNLELGSDEHGRAYIDLALQGVLDRLDQPMSLSTLMRLASAMYQSLQQRDLLLYMDEPDVQSVLERNHWDGRVRADSTDYLYIVDSNVGWSKADRNVQLGASYRVDLSRELGPRVKLTLGYNNYSGPGSKGCQPQWINRGTNYSQLKNACYWDYWRVFVPQGARLLSSTRLPLPEYSVAAEIGRGQPGQDTVSVSSSYNRTVMSGLFALAAGERKTIDLVYDLPSDVLRRDGDDIIYELLIQKQPGARGRKVSVELTLPVGYRLGSSSLEPTFNGDSSVEFLVAVEKDTKLTAVLTKKDDGSS